ncbi:MAG: FG-GAP-like repeat-containing protein [Bacteroidales bacterium]|nr:FG-GAP-like repeat-containing protein [Bacteroidales bacterium]
MTNNHNPMKQTRKILAAVLILNAGVAYSQNKNVITIPPDALNCTNTARDIVFIKPPTSGGKTIVSPANCKKVFNINENIVCDINYQSGENYNRPLNVNLPVGATAGSFNVSADGKANYYIPIILSPGIGGMKPSLGLSYYSVLSDGMIGVGWNLTGLSSISRVTKNIYNDTKASGITMDLNDVFAFDGKRLIIQPDGTYRTEIESFVKVTPYGATGFGPERFVVETKDGLTMDFGLENDSRLYLNGNTNKILEWHLNVVKDQFGNEIHYTYFNTGSEFRIQSIEYTKNGTQISATNKVNFIYENKSRMSKRWVLGSSLLNNVLLKEIRVYAEGSLSHKYVLNYNNDDTYTHLNEVVEYGADGKNYNSTVFSYSKITGDISIQDIGISDHYSNSVLDCGNFIGDFNGDGKDDFVKLHKGLNAQYGYYEYYYSFSFQSGVERMFATIHSNDPEYIKFFNFEYNYSFAGFDLNGDGISDAMAVSSYNGQYKYIPLINVPDNCSYINCRKFQEKDAIILSTNAVSLGDFNADGLQDMIICLPGSIQIRYSAINSNVPAPFSNVVTYNTSSGLFGLPLVGDYNGDGISDALINNKLCLFNPNKNSGNGGFDCYDLPISVDEKILLGDFNGDGLTDFGNRNNLYISKGDGIFEQKSISFIDQSNINKLVSSDIDGDGKTDIIVIHNYLTSGVKFYYNVDFYNNIANVKSKSLYCQSTNVNFGDFNGDGKMDLYHDLYGATDCQVSSKIYNQPGQIPQLLCNIKNGLNKTTSINYTLINSGLFTTIETKSDGTSKEYYIKGSGASYPLMDYMGSMPVVYAVQSSNGIGGNASTFYFYESAKIHLQGRGFMGFMKFTSVNGYRNITDTWGFQNLEHLTKTENNYSINNTYYYTNFNSSNEYFAYQWTNNKFPVYTLKSMNDVYTSYYDYGNKRFLPYTTGDMSKNYIYKYDAVSGFSVSNPKISISTSSYSYSDLANGNIGSVVSKTISNLNTGPVKTKTQTDYTNYIPAGNSGWIPNKCQNVSITKTRDNLANYSRSITYNWDASKGVLNSQVVQTGVKDGGATQQIVTTSYTYNNYGNISETKQIGSDVTDPLTTTIEYETNQRFAIKSKKLTNTTELVNEALFEPKYGNVIWTKDENGLVANLKYDGFGNLQETTLPTGQKITNTIKFELSSGITNAVYSVETTGNGEAPVKVYFDLFGRTLRKQTNIFGGSQIYSTTNYNAYFMVDNTDMPGPNDAPGNTNRIVTQYGYYFPLFLLTGTSSPAGNVKYSIEPSLDGQNQLSIKSTAKIIESGKTSYQISDVSGAVITSADALDNKVNYVYNSADNPTQIISGGQTTTISYDNFGKQLSLLSPDAGTTAYEYDAFARITKQTDAKGNIHKFYYDKIGRLYKKEEIDASNGNTYTYNYYYDTETNGKGKLAYMNGGKDNMQTSYKYDNFGRNYQVIENIDAQNNFTTSFAFDDYSNVSQINYPSGYIVKRFYDSYGNLTQVTDASNNNIWSLSAVNSFNSPKSVNLGTGSVTMNRQYNFDNLGAPSSDQLSVTAGACSWNNKWTYSFNPVTGNLDNRRNELTYTGSCSGITNRNLYESFTYDILDRLTTINFGSNTVNMRYKDDDGNILNKSDVSNTDYSYSSNHPHAVGEIYNSLGNISSLTQDIQYTAFNKVLHIGEQSGTVDVNFIYGPEETRKKVETRTNNNLTSTKYYSSLYEKKVTQLSGGGSSTQELHYISGSNDLAAIYEIKNGAGKMYYAQTDYQGSLNMLVKSDGTIAQDLSYDAWGRRRNAQDWTYNNLPANFITDRGYTMHEHMDAFKLINMNGRLYDPLIGQMLSPDPFVQEPGNTQSYNRYSYCFNNPLKYTDPSGYIAEPQKLTPGQIMKIRKEKYREAQTMTMRGEGRQGYNEFDGNLNDWYNAMQHNRGGFIYADNGSCVGVTDNAFNFTSGKGSDFTSFFNGEATSGFGCPEDFKATYNKSLRNYWQSYINNSALVVSYRGIIGSNSFLIGNGNDLDIQTVNDGINNSNILIKGYYPNSNSNNPAEGGGEWKMVNPSSNKTEKEFLIDFPFYSFKDNWNHNVSKIDNALEPHYIGSTLKNTGKYIFNKAANKAIEKVMEKGVQAIMGVSEIGASIVVGTIFYVFTPVPNCDRKSTNEIIFNKNGKPIGY